MAQTVVTEPDGSSPLISLLAHLSMGAPPSPPSGCVSATNQGCYSVPVSAASYATFFGVLAAGLFSGLIFIVTRWSGGAGPTTSRLGHSNVFKPLLTAFVTLTLVTFFYSTMSGEETINRVAAIDSVASGAAIIAVFETFVALTWLFCELRPLPGQNPSLHDSGGPDLRQLVAAVSGLIMVIAIAFVIATLDGSEQEVARLAYPDRDSWRILWLLSLGTPWIGLGSLRILDYRAKPEHYRRIRQLPGWVGRYGHAAALAFCSVAAIAQSEIGGLDGNQPHKVLGLNTAVALLAGLCLSMQWVSLPPKKAWLVDSK